MLVIFRSSQAEGFLSYFFSGCVLTGQSKSRMSGDSAFLSLAYDEVAALSAGVPMAARSGGARGGSGSRISPRLAQPLNAAGMPRLTVKELEENAAAMRELAAIQAAAKAKKKAGPALALPTAASPLRTEDAKAPTPSSDGVDGRIVLDEEEDVAALILENEQLRRLVAAGRPSAAQVPQASIVALEAQATRTDQILQYLAAQVGALAEKVTSGPPGSSPSAPPATKEKPGSLPFLEPAHKRPGPIDLNNHRIGMFFYADGHIRPHGGPVTP